MSRDLTGYKRAKYADLTPGVRIYRRNNRNQFEDWGEVVQLKDGMIETQTRVHNPAKVSLWIRNDPQPAQAAN